MHFFSFWLILRGYFNYYAWAKQIAFTIDKMGKCTCQVKNKIDAYYKTIKALTPLED